MRVSPLHMQARERGLDHDVRTCYRAYHARRLPRRLLWVLEAAVKALFELIVFGAVAAAIFYGAIFLALEAWAYYIGWLLWI